LHAHALARAFFAAGPGVHLLPGAGGPAGSFAEGPGAGPPPDAGLRIGPYRTLHLIAAGGMGSVYLAERVDAAYRKQVAVKILRAGLGTEDFLARFRTERQVLADLDHPNIARLVDGGSTEEGLPYLVMDYVDGEPVDAYADRNRLGVGERLRLFLKICDAVEYAHQNLVIHRDLKPSNILVDAGGEPKLLDFGIAKVMDPAVPDAAGLTLTANRALTPRYASPEQIRGERVTTSTDVYSLGVVLYELLTGRSPYRIESSGLFDVERAISAGVTTRPSQEVRDGEPGVATVRNSTPRRLAQNLSGDLDTIILRALSKEPERRYRGVQELAADVRRHLEGLPVLARPDTVRYRLSRFAARNRPVVTSVLSIIAVLAVALTVALAANRRARSAAETSEWLAYTNALAAAEYAILNGEKAEAASHLDGVPEELRGWEWRHLHGRLDRSLHRWRGHRTGVTGVAWLPDGTGFLSCSLDSTVSLWPVDSDSALATWTFDAGLESLTVDPAGDVAVVAAGDGSIYLLRPAPGAAPELLGRGSGWPAPAFSPDGARLAVGFLDGSVRVWDLGTREVRSLEGAHTKLALAAFSPTGDTLVTAGPDGDVKLWDAADFTRLGGFQAHPQRVYALDVSGDGKLATGSIDRTARVWRLSTGELLGDFRKHEGTVADLAFTPDGASVVSSGPDGKVLVWNAVTAAVEGELHGHDADVSVVAVSRDGRWIVTGEWTGALRIWDRRTQDVRTLFAHRVWMVSRITEARFDAAGRQVALAGVADAAVVWHLDADTTSGVWRLNIPHVAWAPGDHDLLYPGEDGTLAAISAETESIAVYPRYSVQTLAVAVSPLADRCAVATSDSAVTLWTLPDRTIAARIPCAPAAVSAVFSPDGRRLAFGDAGGAIHLVDAASGDSLASWPAHARAVTSLAYLPLGNGLASASADGHVRVWDPRRGLLLHDRPVSEGPLTALAVHPEGRCLVTAGSDQVLHFLEPRTLRPVVSFHGHVARVAWLEFSRDGSALVSAGFDGAVRLWDAPADPR